MINNKDLYIRNGKRYYYHLNLSYMESHVLNNFDRIKLEEMDEVKLMNRMDRKFWIREDSLMEILQSIEKDYYVLEIDGERKLPYETVYYDTQDHKMYTQHHNGKLNRYKIRRRSYVSTGVSFLEIKFKSNKGRTVKTRISTSPEKERFTQEEMEFLQKNIPFLCCPLDVSLSNRFYRTTLVNKDFTERCTIDSGLLFKCKGKREVLKNLVIVEVKTTTFDQSPLVKALKEHRIKAEGFSKYCIGKAMLDAEVKYNIFKSKILRLQKNYLN